MALLIACTEHAEGLFFSFSVGTRTTFLQFVGGLGILSFLAIVASNGNRRIERAGYVALGLVLLLGGGALAQGEMKPIAELL